MMRISSGCRDLINRLLLGSTTAVPFNFPGQISARATLGSYIVPSLDWAGIVFEMCIILFISRLYVTVEGPRMRRQVYPSTHILMAFLYGEAKALILQ